MGGEKPPTTRWAPYQLAPTIVRSGVIIPSETQLLTRPFMGTPWTPTGPNDRLGGEAHLVAGRWLRICGHHTLPDLYRGKEPWSGVVKVVWSLGLEAERQLKKGHLVVEGMYSKGWDPTQLCGDYFINHDKDPYWNNQYNEKYKSCFRGSSEFEVVEERSFNGGK